MCIRDSRYIIHSSGKIEVIRRQGLGLLQQLTETKMGRRTLGEIASNPQISFWDLCKSIIEAVKAALRETPMNQSVDVERLEKIFAQFRELVSVVQPVAS